MEDVELLPFELQNLERLMEEMANTPPDASLYVRQPGERCSYEISCAERRMIDTLQWAKEFMNNYERRHRKNTK